jgi:predicted solute-binding protein
MEGDLHILRVGYHPRANWLPLLYPLEAGWVSPASPWRLELVAAPVERLAEETLAGNLDAAFLAPWVVAGNGERLSSLGGWGLASEGKSATALLLAPQRLDLMDGSEVSVAREAAGSTAEHMLRILLAPYYGIGLQLRAAGEGGGKPQGARLLYGDDAARQAASRPRGWVAEDLGVAWFVFTGLPAVWEMLATPRYLEERKPGATEQIQEVMRLARRTAQEQQASVLETAAQRLGIGGGQVKELFARQRYSLGEAEHKGLARFLDLAARANV